MNPTNIQQQLITFPSNSRVVVKAGPGTGKTFSLIERIKYLVEEEELEPAIEILVLTFSVAASKEIRNRLNYAVEQGGCDDDVLHVSVRTFDSFATAFMLRLEPENDLGGFNYDQRIVRATDIIKSDENARRYLTRYKHILVDEVQDLVGLRASLTLELLAAANNGFTLLGDPAQAVYNFLMDEDVPGPTSDEFLNEIFSNNEGFIEQIELIDNFRVGENKELRRLAEKGRDNLLNAKAEEAYFFLRNFFSDLDSLGSLAELELSGLSLNAETAFLCRKNGQLLRLARYLHTVSIPFTIRQPKDVKDIPAWVGYVFSRWNSQTIKKKDFINRIKDDNRLGLVDPDRAWQDLQIAARVKNSIRITQFRRILLEDMVFVEGESDGIENCVVLSTIHRAKGREFDNVALVVPEERDPDLFLDEGRVTFVGLTRARKKVFKVSEKGAKGIWKANEENRWIRTISKNEKQYLSGIEVGIYGDIDIHSPVSLEMFEDDVDEIEESQEFLWENVRGGFSAFLELCCFKSNIPIYYVKIINGEDAFAVALTSEKFGRSLNAIIKSVSAQKKIYRFPQIIGDLWVRDIVTEVGNLGNEDVPREYRTSGLWLNVRLQGLGLCQDWR